MLLGALTWFACAPSERGGVEVAPAPWPWILSGCWSMDTGPRCTVGRNRTLTLWVGSETPPVVDAPGLGAVPWSTAEDGFRATFTVAEDAAVVVRSEAGPFTLVVDVDDEPEVVVQGRALARQGDTDAAIETLTAGAASPDVAVRIPAQFRLATLGGRSLAEVETAAEAAGAWWWASRAAMTRAYEHIVDDRDGVSALEALERARAYAEGPGQRLGFKLEYSLDYYEGRAYLSAGNHRAAMDAFRRIEQQSERIGNSVYAGQARQDLAESLLRLGEIAEALDRLGHEVAESVPGDDPCDRAVALNSYGWGLIQAREVGWTDEPSPADVLDEALVALGQTCGPRHHRGRHLAQVHLNRAIAALQDDDADEAAFHLGASRESPTVDEPWALVVDGRIHLARGEPRQALDRFEALEARAGDQFELQWLALRWQGIAHEALDETDAAIVDFERAQSFLFQQALLVPVYLGRRAYLRQRRDTAARLTRLLRSKGRFREAFDAHRRSRASFLGALHHVTRLQSPGVGVSRTFQAAIRDASAAEEQLAALPELWEVPLDQAEAVVARRAALEQEIVEARDRGFVALGLAVHPERRRPDDGEVLLGWFEESDGWVGYAETADGVVAAPLATRPDVATLLGPFTRQIGQAEVVTLLLPESLAHLDVHRAAFRGGPVLASVPVRYAVDVAGPDPTAGRAPLPPRALIISDPRQDLALARDRSHNVAQTLQTQGFLVEQRVGEAATRQAILNRLQAADWLHYSGHGQAGPVWDSKLLVADGTIGVSDVLAVSKTPRVAVINACSMADEADGGVAMATAMVVAGTERALAPTRAVSDRTAERLSERLYGELASGGSVSEAYAATVVSVAAAKADHEVWNYRLYRN